MRTWILTLALLGCSSKSPPQARGVDLATIKADAANALVPEPLRAKLVFDTKGIDGSVTTAPRLPPSKKRARPST